MAGVELDPRLSWAARVRESTRAQAKSLIIQWDWDEEESLIGLIRTGMKYEDIALTLRRTYSAVSNKAGQLRKEGRL